MWSVGGGRGVVKRERIKGWLIYAYLVAKANERYSNNDVWDASATRAETRAFSSLTKIAVSLFYSRTSNIITAGS